jgi:hypothetical protein
MGRGTESHLRSSAGTRSSVDVLVVWMFMAVSLIFVFALERMHSAGTLVPRAGVRYQTLAGAENIDRLSR